MAGEPTWRTIPGCVREIACRAIARARTGVCLLMFVAVIPSGALGQIAPLHPDRQPVILETYRSALGRDPSPQELYYWVLYPETPPGIINATSLFAVLLQTLKNSPAEREGTARRALSAAFGSEESGNPRLRAYLEDSSNPPMRQAIADLSAQREGGGYRGLLAWLGRSEVRQRFIEHTGIAALLKR